MNDADCVALLQWALPRLRMRWRGFRRVRRQVCKRIDRRMRQLEVGDVAAYRRYLADHPQEWARLDEMCRVTISRVWRDHRVYEGLARAVLPTLAEGAAARGARTVRVWSAGCGSGEEPYSIAIAWHFGVRDGSQLEILGTDVDPHLLERARLGRYAHATVRELPTEWRQRAFLRDDDGYRLRAELKEGVTFERADIRRSMPDGPFDAVLCRNLAFTYYEEPLQRELLEAMLARLCAGGALIIGKQETLPDESPALRPWAGVPGAYRRI